MAYILAVVGYSKTNEKELMHVEPTWWKEGEIRSDPRIKEIIDCGCLDYEAKLSVEETRQMHEHFRPLAADKYDSEEWRQKIITPRMKELDSALYERVDEFSHFTVGLYEWSSGM